MPNWTYNSIEMQGIANEELFIEREGEKVFDFNKLIPMPEELSDTLAGGSVNECVVYYIFKESKTKKEFFDNLYAKRKIIGYFFRGDLKPSMRLSEIEKTILDRIGNVQHLRMYDSESWVDSDKFSHTPYEVGKFYYEVREKYGYTDWYDWACKNWGTKWNACHCSIVDNDHISFDTAWAAPVPIFEALAKRYPDRTITVSSVYEDSEGESYCAEYNGDSYKEWVEPAEVCDDSLDYDV